MKNHWDAIKGIVENRGYRKDIFLSLIEEDGTILYANAFMVQTLELRNPKVIKSNFFDLVNPADLDRLKNVIQFSRDGMNPYSIEIFLKNGSQHFVKMNVQRLHDGLSKKNIFLCEALQLLDAERMQKFMDLQSLDCNSLFSDLDHGILILGKEGELLFANQRAANIFNITLEVLYHVKNISQLWNARWRMTNEKGNTVPYDQTPFHRAFSSGFKENEFYFAKTVQGKEKLLNITTWPLRKPEVQESIAVMCSISEEEVHEVLPNWSTFMHAYSESFIKHTPDLLWLVDEEAHLLYANESFYKYFGITPKDLHKKITDLVPTTVAEALYGNHLTVLETGVPQKYEKAARWADGKDFSFQIYIFPAGEQNNKKILAGHAVRIADKFAVEKQLREANDQLLVLSRAAVNAIWDWDIRKDQIFRNETLLDMIGYPIEETNGLSWWLQRIHESDRDRVHEKVKLSIEEKKVSWEESYQFLCKDGTYKHICDRGYIIYEDGVPVKMIGSLQDMTTLKELETRLTEERMRRQKEISETVIQVQERERNRIGYELHDNINQILTTVMLFVNMLNPDKEPEKQIKSKIHEYVCLSIEEITKLSRELVEPKMKETGLVESVRLLIDDIHISNALRIQFSFDSEIELVTNAKKVTLFRIVQEQLKNILKHSKATEASIGLLKDQNNLFLSISDNGIGFDANQTFRGIGLSNIHERTRFYNGSVDVQSSAGQGCRLTVSIPA